MILPYEASPDIIFTLVNKVGVLNVHNRGLLQPTKKDLETTENYSCFGIFDKNSILKGVLDIVQTRHLVLNVSILLEVKDVELLTETVEELKEKATLAGMRKIQLTVFCGIESLADILKTSDFLPEVKFRSHIFVNGNLFPLTEYGVLL